MKTQSWFTLLATLALVTLSTSVLAGNTTEKLPQDEQGFVTAIGKLKRSEIIALLGEPARAEDVKLKDSGRVVASIWHYHNINKDPQGAYYPTTELDLIDDQVSVIVFLNNDGSDATSGQTYEIQPTP
ncbi:MULTISPECIES: hypothetical protein [unclassified Methylophilus]|jgi:hypothetical protein|uniref:hypothetical protein n=1 Tax=unclassified Methylophilus TaxID=2630143 RepID=UPI0006FDDF4A|nr:MULTISPECIES: hypothetical protein [unclassified Methylophilus]KQT43704.1 hypothetical protein ASG34_02685 [Methylophilus sp. Leaf416]KQT59190.1 hypothetical protein ASG44_02690 [Methylophilus sp. Leaf459]